VGEFRKGRAEIITKGEGNPFFFTRKNTEGYIWEDRVKLAELFKMACTVCFRREA
jgi:hypothetical protein